MIVNARRIGAVALGAALGLAAALVVASPASAPPPRAGAAAPVLASASPPPPATADPDSAGMDPGCSRSLVRGVVTSFIQAFNRGEQQALAGLFGPQDDFMWFSVSNRHDHLDMGRWLTYEISALPAYFAARHLTNERLTLREIQLSGGRSGRRESQAGFGILLERTADDLPAELGLLEGKAAIRCDTRTIKLWAVAVSTRASPP